MLKYTCFIIWYCLGADSAVLLGSEFTLKEHTEAGRDRVLMEELKSELFQTKLELETTLKAQHKHLKELDALRLDTTLQNCGSMERSKVSASVSVFI